MTSPESLRFAIKKSMTLTFNFVHKKLSESIRGSRTSISISNALRLVVTEFGRAHSEYYMCCDGAHKEYT